MQSLELKELNGWQEKYGVKYCDVLTQETQVKTRV